MHVVSDVKKVIQLMKDDDDWSSRSIIADIKGLFSLYRFVSFSFLSLGVSMVKLINLPNSAFLLIRILYRKGLLLN